MLFGADQWPGGQNLMTSPVLWRKMFQLIPSPNFGLNFDPSHFVWQQMDYIQPLYEFKDRLFHVHCKDIKLYPEKLAQCGVMAYPLEYMSPKIPGLGDVDWSRYLSALYDVGYDGDVCIEVCRSAIWISLSSDPPMTSALTVSKDSLAGSGKMRNSPKSPHLVSSSLAEPKK